MIREIFIGLYSFVMYIFNLIYNTIDKILGTKYVMIEGISSPMPEGELDMFLVILNLFISCAIVMFLIFGFLCLSYNIAEKIRELIK